MAKKAFFALAGVFGLGSFAMMCHFVVLVVLGYYERKSFAFALVFATVATVFVLLAHWCRIDKTA